MALVAELAHPENYAVAFLPVKPGDESFAFLVALTEGWVLSRWRS